MDNKKNINQEPKKTNNHYGYFYKEKDGKDIKTFKDFFIKTDFKQYLKWIGKGFKWMMYIFLGITTLWGCVQGFTVVQSNMLSHGFEIYNNSEEVYPNSYLTFSTASAELSDEAKIQEVIYATPAGEGVGLSGTIWDFNYGCGNWNEEPEEEGENVNWKVQETANCWIDGNPSNYTQENFKLTSEFYITPSLMGGIGFGEFVGEDIDENEVRLENGISSLFLNPMIRIDSASLFKYVPMYEQTLIDKWNNSLELNEDDDRYIEPATDEEMFAYANEYLSAFYSGELYLGEQDGLLYPTDDVLQESAWGVEWDNTITIEQAKDDNLEFNDIYTQNLNDGQNYNSYLLSTPKVYLDVIPETTGLHIDPSASASTFNGELGIYGRDDELWEEAVASGSNKEMVKNVGWTFLSFSNFVDNDDDQYVPGLYDSAEAIDVDENGNIIENEDPIDYLYRTNKVDWKTSFTYDPKNPSEPPDNGEPLNEDPFVNSGKYMAYVNWTTVYSLDDLDIENPENYVTGAALEFGGINYWNYTDSKWNNAITEKTQFYISDINNTIDESLESVGGEENPETAVNKDDYSDYIKQYSGFSANQSERVIITDWSGAWQYGPFYGMFVFPLSYIVSAIDSIFPESMGGWSVFLGVLLIVFIVRGFSTLITFKSFLQQQKMQDVQLKVAKVNAKYEKYEDNSQMKQRKQMEVMKIYQKEGVNPLGSMSSVFLTMPMFLAMWRIITSLPAYKGASIGAIDFTVTPLAGVFNTGVGVAIFIYLLILMSTIMMQFISFKLPTWLSQKRKGITHIDEKTKKAMKKNNKIGNWMIAFFIIMSITIPTLLAIYWMLSGLFTMSTTWGQHLYLTKKASAQKNNEEWYGPIERVKIEFRKIGKTAIGKFKKDKDIKVVKGIISN